MKLKRELLIIIITNTEFNILAAGVFTSRLAPADLVTKSDFDTKLQDISNIITSNKSKHLLIENKLKKLQKIDSSYFEVKIVLKKIVFKIT